MSSDRKDNTKDEDLEEDTDSVYDVDDESDVDVDVDDEPNRNEEKATKEDDDEDDEDDEPAPMKAKPHQHVYHQIPDSSEIKIVAPANRITSEYMTIYEYSMVIGTRATHISEGSVLYTDPQGLYDPRDIAKKEINENKCPLSITRKVSPTMIEVWEVNEMIKPQI